MKVVLIKDVRGVGGAHETVEVKDGYALHLLIPQRLAVSATPSAVKDAEARLRLAKARRDLDAKLVGERIAALAEGHLTIQKKVNEKGHLYDAIDAREIAELAELPTDVIKLEKPIKELGTFKIPIAYGEKIGEFSIIVEKE